MSKDRSTKDLVCKLRRLIKDVQLDIYRSSEPTYYQSKILHCIGKFDIELESLDENSIITDISKDIPENGNKEFSRRSRFRFSMIGVPIGSTLSFLEDPSIKVVVADDMKVLYQGKLWFTSQLAEKLLKKKSVQGPKYFLYNGKTLDDLRNDGTCPNSSETN